MSVYKRKNIFETLIEKWDTHEFTVKDRELLYRRFINEDYDLSEKNINDMYTAIIPWLQKKDQKYQEIIIWYKDNNFPLFPFYLFSLLALCAVYKVLNHIPTPPKDIIHVLLQSLCAALGLKNITEVNFGFFQICDTWTQKKTSITSIIYQALSFIKENYYSKKDSKASTQLPIGMLYERMCSLTGAAKHSTSCEKTVSVNTMLIYHSRDDKKEKGITATLILAALSNRFGDFYPSEEILRLSRFSRSFYISLKNVETYIKNELKAWPGDVDIRWQLIPDNRDISLEHKTFTGRSLEAAFIIGILKLYSRFTLPDTLDTLKKELTELDLKFTAITATVNRDGTLGKVGGIWKKMLEAARIKIPFILVAREQSMCETTKINILKANTIGEGIKKLHKATGPGNIKEQLKGFLLTYATETKELENRCNDAFQGEDLTNIKGSVRFTDKPVIYVQDIIDICFTYGMIKGKHPLIRLLEKIEDTLPLHKQEEIRELKVRMTSSLLEENNRVTESNTSFHPPHSPGVQEKKVVIRNIETMNVHPDLPLLNKKGNPYINRTTIHHPDRFYGRQKILTRLSRRIGAARPQSVSIVGERRIGKSSLLHYLTFLTGNNTYLDKPGFYIFMYLDCQGMRSATEQQFISIIFTELKRKLKNNIEFTIDGTIDDLRFLGEEITKKGLKLILLFDEFESITKNSHFSPAFYSMLRSLANNYTVALITSSVKRLKDMCISREISDSPFFNIFTIQHLGLFEPNEAKELITKPSLDHGIPLEKLSDRIIEESGLHPFFLQIMCCSWFDYLDNINRTEKEIDTEKTPKEVLHHFREESLQHFEFIYDTLPETERSVLQAIRKEENIHMDTPELEILERKGYIIRKKGDIPVLFSSEFERFIHHYRR